MRKRSKKRIPQDERSWARVVVREDSSINIFNKAVSHWHSGNRRYKQNKVLYNQQYKQLAMLCINSLMQDDLENYKDKEYFSKELIGTMMYQRLFHKYYFCKSTNTNSVKNFCLFLGKNSTYSRQLFASRQAVRKLMKTGLLTGMQKK